MFVPAWLSLIASCAVLWAPAAPLHFLTAELLTAVLLVARLAGGRSAMLVLLPAAFAVSQSNRQLAERLPDSEHGRDRVVVGQVCSFPTSDDRASRFELLTDRRGAESPLPRRLAVAWYEQTPPPRPGEYWQFKLRLRTVRGLRNPGAGDSERRLFARGIGARAYVRPSPLNRRLPSPPDAGQTCSTMGLRAAFAMAIDKAIADSPARPYLLALTVGARHALRPADWELLRRTGTVHLMAISGLHIGLVAGLGLLAGRSLARLAARLGLIVPPAVIGPGLAVVSAAAYASLAGFAVPTVRALLMVSVAAAAAMLRRRPGSVSLLGAVLYAVLLWQPLAPLMIGFWLSFAAVSLLLMRGRAPGRPDTERRRWRKRLMELVVVQMRITLGMAPIGLFLFGQQSIVSPLANLVAIPVVGSLVVPLSLTGALLAWAGGGAWLIDVAAWLLQQVLVCLRALAGMPGAHWQPMPVAAWACALGFLGAVCWLWPAPFRQRWIAVIAAVPLFSGAAPEPAVDRLRLVVMDVGQGLAVLVQTRRHALLYDAGPAWGAADAGATIVVPVLRHFGIARLDRIIVSHGDGDHAGGLSAVQRQYPDAPVMAPAGQLRGRTDVRACGAGIAWHWDGIRFEILHPPESGSDRWRSDNDRSCVVKVTAPGARILLTGDISRAAERSLVAAGSLDIADLVVAPHHGSASSSGPELIRATRPRFVVVSAGYRNRWGLPRPEVMRRWREAGACLFNTAELGALEFVIHAGSGLRLRSAERRDASRLWTLPAPAHSHCGAPPDPV